MYVEVPKVACSSIKIAFAGLLGVDLGVVGGNPHKVRFPAPALPSGEAGAVYPGLFSFAFVRNPWDRLVSCYRDKVLGEAPDFTSFDPARGVAHCLARFDVFRGGMSFEEFVDAVAGIPDAEADGHFRSQCTFVTDSRGEVALDVVGRYETLESDFRRVCEHIGLPPLKLPWVQASRSSVRYEFYDRQTRSTVQRRFAEDIELFGYEFGSD